MVRRRNPPIRRTNPSGTKLITLGTARRTAADARIAAQSSNLLVVNGTLYLIDAGDSVTRRIVQAGHDFRKVGKIFITHPHSDHTAGLATLLVSQWEYQRAEPTDVYGGGVEALVKGALAYLTPNAEIRWAEGKKRPMADTFHGHDVSRGRDLPGRQREGDRGREHALQVRSPARRPTASTSRSPTASIRPDRIVPVHRRHRPVRRGGRARQGRRRAGHRGDRRSTTWWS